MIVKNEVSNIKRAIESAREIADEIIVNDTGSTDGTQGVLESLGVSWFQSRWENDFSLARNQCLEKAVSSWIFWLDADDELPEETVKAVCRFKKGPSDRILGFEVINTEGRRELGARFLQIRMFPNHPHLRFERRIHEQIEPSAARLGLYCQYHPAPIYHRGYQDTEMKKRKAERNLRLILEDRQRLTEDPSFAMGLGDAYYILEQWEKGIQAYLKVSDIPNCREINQEAFHEVPACVGLGYLKLKQWEEAINWLEKAMAVKPEKVESKYYLAEAWEEGGHLEEAQHLYEIIIKMPRPATGSVNRFDAIHMNSFLRLGKIQYQKKEFQNSISTLNSMRQKYPDLVEPCYWLGKNYRELKEFTRAISAWLEGLKLNPMAVPEMYRELLELLEKTGPPEMVAECKKMGQEAGIT